MSQKSPLSIVTEKFGGKDKLVDQIVGLLGSDTDEPKEDLRKRLLTAANRKLIRLHGVASTVKDKYGSRAKLVEAAAAGRTKDKDFVAKLETYSTAKLVDLAQTAERRAKRAQVAAATK